MYPIIYRYDHDYIGLKRLKKADRKNGFFSKKQDINFIISDYQQKLYCTQNYEQGK